MVKSEYNILIFRKKKNLKKQSDPTASMWAGLTSRTPQDLDVTFDVQYMRYFAR